jgi:sterol desaturase/sphingolipid hydroxylase (fatty acid hydroxylase superfamily)
LIPVKVPPHPLDPAGAPENFAVWFPFYDVLFGTACRPKPGEFPETGVEGVEVLNLSRAFMLPLERWGQMAKGLAKLH